jgi:hypothetical protein
MFYLLSGHVMSGQAILDLRIMVLNMKCHIKHLQWFGRELLFFWQPCLTTPLPGCSTAWTSNQIKSSKTQMTEKDIGHVDFEKA